jgi:hypothetical protein
MNKPNALLKCALADLEGIIPEFEPSGDREHPAWKTMQEIRDHLETAQASSGSSTVHCLICDHTYPELTGIFVALCPKCKNSDPLKSVYLVDDSSLRMKRYDSYEIFEVGEIDVTGLGEFEVSRMALISDDEKSKVENTYWTIYGRYSGMEAEAIADRSSYAEIRELYFSMTGNDCGESQGDKLSLPVTNEFLKKSYLDIFVCLGAMRHAVVHGNGSSAWDKIKQESSKALDDANNLIKGVL